MLRRLARATDVQSQQVWRVLFRYTGLLNQVFAGILIVWSAVAIVLWLSVLRGPALRSYGMVSKGLLAALVVAGPLPLDVHDYGLVVLLQGGWFAAAAAKMWNGTLSR